MFDKLYSRLREARRQERLARERAMSLRAAEYRLREVPTNVVVMQLRKSAA